MNEPTKEIRNNANFPRRSFEGEHPKHVFDSAITTLIIIETLNEIQTFPLVNLKFILIISYFTI